MQRKHRLTILFSVVLLVLLGCNPATQLPNSQNTPNVQDTPTSYTSQPTLNGQDTPTPTPTPISLPNPVSHYKVTGQEGQQQVTYSGLICNLEQPFTLTANTNWWEMTFQLTPANPQAGSFTVTGTHYDVGPYAGEGAYTVHPVNEELSQLTLNFTILTETTSLGVINVTPSPYHVELIPLVTRECEDQ